MDAFLKPATAQKPVVAPIDDSKPSPLTAEARAAWAEIAKPVCEESFVAWYTEMAAARIIIKRAIDSASEAPAAKKPRAAPASSAAAASGTAPAALSKGKRTALLKAVSTSLKAAIKGKKTKWHAGDSDTLAGSTVCDASDFAALFPGVSMTKKGVATSFTLDGDSLAAAFGDSKLSVPTWQAARSFQKAHKTGSEEVAIVSAEGKYSTGTSTLTLKFSLKVAGGRGYGGCGSDY